MENLVKDLSIPANQITNTSNENCFIVTAHRSWLKSLSNGNFAEFIRRQEDAESAALSGSISWCNIHIKIYKKNSQKVIPLTRNRSTENDQPNLPLTYSQLMHFVSQTNHRNLWKSAYKKYVKDSCKAVTTSERPTSKKSKSNNDPVIQNLLPHDVVLRDIITRIYACRIIDARVEIVCRSSDNEDAPSDAFTHPNLYPTICAIESHNNFFVIHQPFVQYTLRDLQYSPAILSESHNKPLFILYQLINLIRSMHDRNLLVGYIGIEDIFLTDNLWLQVIPKLDKNLLVYDDWIEQQQEIGDLQNPTIKRHLSTSCVSDFGKSSVQLPPTTKIERDLPVKYSLNEYCKMWCHGELTNFDYLTILNDLSGRRRGNPLNGYIFPWVTDFSGRNGMVWRDLTKSKYRLNKGDAQLDLTFQSLSLSTSSTSSMGSSEMPHHVSDVLSEITYYVYLARRTPKALLCKHVRPIWVPAEYPASIQRLQAWSPDECIPEFYSDPLVFKSIHEDLPDLEVPAWSTCPEDFIYQHREALESQNVSEKLNHWIDLTFGYKLTGDAAVKAKNVCLSLVDGHKNLCQNGVVQLFFHPHPPKQFPSVWTGKVPPRIYLHSDSKKRLTRSSEDLSQNIDNTLYSDYSSTPSSSTPRTTTSSASSSASGSRTIADHLKRSTQQSDPIERSPSYHVNVQRTSSVIVLPKNYNPVAQLSEIENMELFLSKTFHNVNNVQTENPIEKLSTKESSSHRTLFDSHQDCGNATDGYTNRIFSQNYEALLCKENKMIQNLLQQRNTNTFPKSKRTQKQLLNEMKIRELQMLGCLIVELFLSDKLRAMTGCANTVKDFEERLEKCVRILKYEFESLPKCLQYSVKLLLGILNDEEENGASSVVTNLGLPVPSAQQLLQPILSNSLIPFSHNYAKLFTLVKSLHQFDETQRLLDLQTFFECDGKHCSQFETLDRTRTAFTRKIAECKVKSTVVLIEGLLEINPHEQFNSVELLLPHIIDLFRNNETSILAAWYIFDPVAQCLGVRDTQKYLLAPILALYDVDTGDRKDIHMRNSDVFSSSSVRSGNSSFKSRKTIKLYHHSFLLRLIVRFGLRCFLENFTSPLIEAVGGKDPESDSPHLHEFRTSRSQRNLKLNSNEEDLIEGADESSNTLVSPNDMSDKSSEKTLSPSSVPIISTTSLAADPQEEMFAFEGDENGRHLQIPQQSLDDSSDTDAEQAILKIIDQFELTSDGSSIDLKLNHSQAEEAFEYAAGAGTQDENFQISDFMGGDGLDQTKLFSSSCYSFEEDKISYTSVDSPLRTTYTEPTAELKSPTIPIPSSFRKSIEVNSIGCEIGSKKSIDSGDFLSQTPLLREEYPKSSSSTTATTTKAKPKINKSTESASMYTSASSLKPTRSSRMSEMSSESLIWLSHRLGPVLTARYLTRNLLKMLTLCYVGQENLLPDDTTEPNSAPKLQNFTIAEGRVNGDIAAAKVLEVLVAVSALFGEQFILLQYFPVAIELISLCKKKITPSLEGGLISSLQLVKYLIPYLNDATIMDQLQDVILRGILHPIIRILASTKHCMPSGYLARSVLARKLVDCVYVLATRIGVQMTREHLDMAMQRFFLIFDKAYGINRDDHVRDEKYEDMKNSTTTGEDSNFLEIRRDGLIQEWSIQGERIARLNSEDSLDSYTPPHLHGTSTVVVDSRERAIEEIRDVFTPGLAHTTYLKFLKYLGEQIMCHIVKNIPVILNLCHEYQQILNEEKNSSDIERSRRQDSLEDTVDGMCSNSFGNNVIGNRIEVPASDVDRNSEKEADDLIAMVAYKLENVNSSRNLRGNWMAYWEHEVGRSDKDNRFNFKQIKLQTFMGHSNSVRSILALDNENSFLSASKDKTVKLWSCRSEGDGNKISSCQFTYLNHRKSVHSLAFLESFRWAVSCDSGVHIWDPYLGQHVGQLDTNKYSHVSVVKTFPSPTSLVICGTAESSVKFIDARTFKYINEWKVTSSATATVRCIAVAPSKNWIAVGLNSGQLVILDGRTGMILASWKACDGEILQLIAPNDNQLISSGLDHNISVWNTLDGSLMFNMRSPPEPAHCLLNYNQELIIGTPANRIGIYSQLSSDATHSFTKLRSETFRGVLTHLQILPLNRTLLVGGDSGNITLFC